MSSMATVVQFFREIFTVDILVNVFKYFIKSDQKYDSMNSNFCMNLYTPLFSTSSKKRI